MFVDSFAVAQYLNKDLDGAINTLSEWQKLSVRKWWKDATVVSAPASRPIHSLRCFHTPCPFSSALTHLSAVRSSCFSSA